MTDPSTPTPPPLPDRTAADAAADPPTLPPTRPDAGHRGRRRHGCPPPVGDLDDIGRGFLSALFDITFTRFITRRLGERVLPRRARRDRHRLRLDVRRRPHLRHRLARVEPGGGIALILSTIVVVPVVAFFAVVVLRFVIESGVALVAIAENTERTAAEHARD
jgi:hypothetical protein